MRFTFLIPFLWFGVLFLSVDRVSAQIDIYTGVRFTPGNPKSSEIDSDGRFMDTDGSGSYLDVTLTKNGGTFGMYLAAGDLISPALTSDWYTDEPSWLRIDYVNTIVDPPLPQDVTIPTIGFRSDQISPLTTGGAVAALGPEPFVPRQFFMSPADERYVPGFLIELLSPCVFAFDPCPAPDATQFVEFSYAVTQVPDPLPGDINLDDRVAFDDFLILADNYQRCEPLDVGAVYSRGDLTRDLCVRFDDFLILSEGFGASRDPVMRGPSPFATEELPVAFLVPEPNANLMVQASIFLLAAVATQLRRNAIR